MIGWVLVGIFVAFGCIFIYAKIKKREKILTITVKKGWKPGTRITFEQEGDQGPNSIPADIVFIVRDKAHPIFRREGTNLIYTQKIPLALALVGTTIHVPTLDGRVLDIPITDVVK